MTVQGLTDPSYCGQIVTFTYPNGIPGHLEDAESSRPQFGFDRPNVAAAPALALRAISARLLNRRYPGNYGNRTLALTRNSHGVASSGGISTLILDQADLLDQCKMPPADG